MQKVIRALLSEASWIILHSKMQSILLKLKGKIMSDTEMLYEYIKIRDLNQERYLTLSKKGANLLLALKNLFNAESININLIVDKMNEYLDNRWEIEKCRNAVMRMNENIYYCEKVGITNEFARSNN